MSEKMDRIFSAELTFDKKDRIKVNSILIRHRFQSSEVQKINLTLSEAESLALELMDRVNRFKELEVIGERLYEISDAASSIVETVEGFQMSEDTTREDLHYDLDTHLSDLQDAIERL